MRPRWMRFLSRRLSFDNPAGLMTRPKTTPPKPIGPGHLLAMATGLLLVALIHSSCTQVTVTPVPVDLSHVSAPGAPPTIDATQLGGKLWVEHDGVKVHVDNTASFEDTTDMVKGITNTISLLKATLGYLDNAAAKDAAAAGIENAKVGNEAASAADAAELARLQEANRAAEALAVP